MPAHGDDPAGQHTLAVAQERSSVHSQDRQRMSVAAAKTATYACEPAQYDLNGMLVMICTGKQQIGPLPLALRLLNRCNACSMLPTTVR
jgi:hypothetical protein